MSATEQVVPHHDERMGEASARTPTQEVDRGHEALAAP